MHGSAMLNLNATSVIAVCDTIAAADLFMPFLTRLSNGYLRQICKTRSILAQI